MIQIRAGMPSASYQQHLKDQNATLLFDLVRRRLSHFACGADESIWLIGGDRDGAGR